VARRDRSVVGERGAAEREVPEVELLCHEDAATPSGVHANHASSLRQGHPPMERAIVRV
jgi:hypothetical protein